VTYPIEERLLDKVAFVPGHACWWWLGATGHSGYGTLWNGEKYDRPHRMAFMLYRGPIPDGCMVLHTCDNPACVNPAHLFLGTQSDNMRDMHAKRRGNRRLRNGPAGLTRNDVLSILDELADGRSQRRVAKKYGVSQTFMWAVRTKRLWPDVERG